MLNCIQLATWKGLGPLGDVFEVDQKLGARDCGQDDGKRD